MSKRKKQTTAWAIQGVWGGSGSEFLYYGTSHTRREAIRDWTEALGKTWAQARKEGVRAVKVTLTWSVAP